MELTFAGPVYEWRGPAPYYFVRVPDDVAAELDEWRFLSYGWGMLPVIVRVGATAVPTALWPKDGGYVVPLKTALRRAEHIELGDEITVTLVVEGEPT